MNRILLIIFALIFFTGCRDFKGTSKRIPVAQVGNVFLYYDEIPLLIKTDINKADSTSIIQDYINKWAKRQLLLLKAEENLSSELKDEIAKQIEETRANLLIYQYQRQM